MPFMHPALFYGGAAAVSVPVIIHLLNRRRFKVLDWAAMRFLLESVRKNRRRVQIEELILLALRCLAIFLLAVAVSRFLGCRAADALPVGARAQTTHVLVIDDSASMGQKIADTTVFAKALSDAAELVRQIPPADRLAVLRTSQPARAKAFFPLDTVGKPEELAGRLKGLRCSDTTGRLGEALQSAAEIFKGVKTDKRLYLISDFRQRDYVSAAVEEVRKPLQELVAQKVELTALGYGAAAGANLTVEGLKVLDRLAVAGVPVRVEVTVRNNGPGRAENVPVRLAARGGDEVEVKLPTRTITAIDPGQSAAVQVAYAFPDAGAGLIEARLPGDTLAGDNVGHLALDVRAARKVLIVDGEPDITDPEKCESFNLVAAIDPTGDAAYGSTAEVISSDRLADADFEKYDAVILANVRDFPAGDGGYPQLDALGRYVRAGGGLAIFTGDRVDPQFYTRSFYSRGAGLCPLPIAAPEDPEAIRRRERYVRLLRDSIANDAVLRTFQGERSQFTQLVRFFGHSPVKVSEMVAAPAAAGSGPAPADASAQPAQAARVLARFDNTASSPQHSPAIVTKDYGRGTVIMVLTSADTEWTDWPKDVTFVPFVHDMLEFISRPGGGQLTDLVGRPIGYAVARELAAASVLLRTPAFPAEDVVSLKGREEGAGRWVSYEDTRHAGIYQLKLVAPDVARVVPFARNVDPVEGLLKPATEKELRAALQVELAYQDKLAAGMGPAAALAAGGREYWKAALAALLIILAVEVYLGQRFGHYYS